MKGTVARERLGSCQPRPAVPYAALDPTHGQAYEGPPSLQSMIPEVDVQFRISISRD